MSQTEQLTPEKLLLSKAFSQFAKTSERLEKQFNILSLETENLKKKLRAKEEEVKRGERLATLGKTAAAVAHEVRNPLGALRLFLGLLADDVQDKPSSLGLISEMEKSIVTIDHVVSNILQFAKEKEIVKSPINLNSVIKSAISQVFPGGDAAIEVKLTEGESPYILGDEISLRQAFVNLILNAAQAIKTSSSKNGVVEIAITTSERNTTITIVDNGPGISRDIAPRLFEPFVTSKKEGTGLGLAIVAQIIAQHGGTISARNRSDVKSGAEFRLEFKN